MRQWLLNCFGCPTLRRTAWSNGCMVTREDQKTGLSLCSSLSYFVLCSSNMFLTRVDIKHNVHLRICKYLTFLYVLKQPFTWPWHISGPIQNFLFNTKYWWYGLTPGSLMPHFQNHEPVLFFLESISRFLCICSEVKRRFPHTTLVLQTGNSLSPADLAVPSWNVKIIQIINLSLKHLPYTTKGAG